MERQDWTSLLSQLFSCITDSVCRLCCVVRSTLSLFVHCILSSLFIVFFFTMQISKHQTDLNKTSSVTNPSSCFLVMVLSFFFFPPPLNLPFFFFCWHRGLLCASMCESQGHVFPLLPCSLCSPGHSRSDLFYVSSVLVVTQPEVCSKTHRLMFSPLSFQVTQRLLSVFSLPLSLPLYLSPTVLLPFFFPL